MAGTSTAGPLGLCVAPPPVDEGTMCLTATPAPGTLGGLLAGGETAMFTSMAAVPSQVTDPDIEALDLRGAAKRGAYAVKKAHPDVTFTSGRRDKADQARAMASNVVHNRKWIEQTYVSTPVSRACQDWVDANTDATSQDAVAEGLLSVLDATTDADLAKLSRHLSGDAFDVQPVSENADAIKKTIRNLPGLDKFLEKEGGLIRWHAQF